MKKSKKLTRTTKGLATAFLAPFWRWALLDRGNSSLLIDQVMDEKLFVDMLNRVVTRDDKLLSLLEHILSSEEGFGRILSFVGEFRVGTRNQADREAWLERTLKALPAGWRILDAGAGELQYKRFCSHLTYVSQDFAKYNGIGDNSGLQTGKWDQNNLDIISDIEAIPESNSSFDAIMCIEVLEHLPDPVKALKEFSRLLRPGGILVITAPFCSLTHFAPYHMMTGFNQYFYHHHLPLLGFDVIEVTPNGNYFEYMAQEARRIEYVAERYAHASLDRKEKFALKVVLKMLDRLSKQNHQSEELLNFGYFVKAERLRI